MFFCLFVFLGGEGGRVGRGVLKMVWGRPEERGGGIVFELKFISILEGKGWVCWG